MLEQTDLKKWVALTSRNLASRERTIDLINKYLEQGDFKRCDKLKKVLIQLTKEGSDLVDAILCDKK